MEGGTKYDGGKLRYDLIPIGPLAEVAKVYTLGAEKYDDRNWEKGLAWGRVYAALQRHANAWWGGEVHDPVEGQHHLSSVVWCALALMEFEQTHPELDDRSRPVLRDDEDTYIIEVGGVARTGEESWAQSLRFSGRYPKAKAKRIVEVLSDEEGIGYGYRIRQLSGTSQVIQ